MNILVNALLVLLTFTSSSTFAYYYPAPPMEVIHLVCRVGEKFSLATPDSTGDFCNWRFISANSGRFLTYDEGIDRIEKYGVIRFKEVKYHRYYRPAIAHKYYYCDEEDQMVMIFKAKRPGQVIFYMQNKEAWQIDPHPPYYYGCNCSPTIRQFVVDVIP